ncbi:MAG: M14 family metallopeptidase, partial [Calditrichia bacterium]
LIQAGIHAGEIDGKDAGFMLIRDMVIRGSMDSLLDKASLLFIPIFNVDGHERFGPYNRINQSGPEEMGWRVTAQNLNLNRDFLKADAPEMQAWLRLFNEWKPDFLVDCHVTDGADYQYAVTYDLERYTNIAEPLRVLNTGTLVPFLEQKMENEGFPVIHYVMFRNWSDINSGLMARATAPRYSTGYGAVRNRIFFLIETHMLKDYKTRVTATYKMLKNLLLFINRYSGELRSANQKADRLTADSLQGRYLPIQFETSMQDSEMIDFRGVKYDRISSDISGTDRVIYHTEQPHTFKMPYYNTVSVKDSVQVPYAYLVPPQWKLQIDRLRLHGLNILYLKRDTTLQVNSYRFTGVQWRELPFEGHHTVSCTTEPLQEKRFFPAGTAVIIMNQPASRAAVHLLEPKAPDSFISWGFWDTIFEQKEYAEGYVMEQLAREMLKKNPRLKEEFQSKLAGDSAFAASPRQRLYFFYRRSPYWDERLNLYPVRILPEKTVLPLTEETPFFQGEIQ